MLTTDVRSNVIERSGLFSEKRFALAISEFIAAGKLPTKTESDIRKFIINVNLKSNGRYFGDMSQKEIWSFLSSCV